MELPLQWGRFATMRGALEGDLLGPWAQAVGVDGGLDPDSGNQAADWLFSAGNQGELLAEGDR